MATASGGSRRVLVSTYGSAGDLFPLIPIAQRLMDDGHDVRFAVPRALGLYLRSMGWAATALGDGTELRVMDDDSIFNGRFDGWDSWRQTVLNYVGPELKASAAILRRMFEQWMPDVVLVSGFAAAARVAAQASGIDVVNASIYPQHEALADHGRAFAPAFVRACSNAAGPSPVPELATRLAWGVPADFLLHDPLLLRNDGLASKAVGYPYWDGACSLGEDPGPSRDWLRSTSGPVAVVTLGSFVGLAQRQVWLQAGEAVASLGARALFIGARGRWAEAAFGHRPDIRLGSYLPLSQVLPLADVVVHHGGLGTSIAAIRAGCPAVVLPQAFDQGHNARLLQSIGAGIEGGSTGLAAGIARVLASPEIRETCVGLAASFISSEDAVQASVERVLRDSRQTPAGMA